jgi:hypothetical protein
MRLLRAAVMRGVLAGIGQALVAALGTVQRPRRSPLPRAGTGGDPARVTFRCHGKSSEGALQDGEQAMQPGVGLGVAEAKVQAVQRWQRMRLLIDQAEEPLVFPLGQAACGPPADLPLASLALPGLVRGIQRGIGRSTRREHTGTLCVRQSGRGQKLSRLVLPGDVS